MNTLQWGIIGTGAIARAFAFGLKQSRYGKLVAVGSRSAESAEAFGQKNGPITCHGSYEALLADPNVQAVYISTPHPFHAEWTIKAIEAGKHVLCEKPLALNQWQAQAMIAAARKEQVFLAEAFMYRFHPQTAKLVELIRDGIIGEVRLIRASFGFNAGSGFDPKGRLFNNSLGGGAILDVGGYAVSGARLVAGAAIGKPFDNPESVFGCGTVGNTAVDEWAAAVLRFPSGIVAQVATSIRASLDNVLEVAGSEGQILVPAPWAAGRDAPVTGKIIVTRGKESTTHEVPTEATSFAMEADGVAMAIEAGRLEAVPPAMTWEDSLGNLAVLDSWRQQVNMVYEAEKPLPSKANVSGKPIQVNTNSSANKMSYGRIAGLDKPVSKLILGGLIVHGSFAKAQVLFDRWLECGGNTFDTAYVYKNCDRILGEWINSRGVRDEVVVVAKGAHTPWCDPINLTRELLETLDRMKTDTIDIYIMHRDNEAIPVGEFIDVLNEHVQAGRIRAFGGSNWSPQRFMEANAYATAKGRQGMSILNNNLSLARMVDPVWPGCLHMSDTASRQWLSDNKVAHFAWSSQARGFFTDRTTRELEAPGFDPELRRCWFSNDNLERRKRVLELADKKGVLPINIAAAYVLCQPFESYALIGPETVDELDTSLPALEFSLTQGEINYLWG